MAVRCGTRPLMEPDANQEEATVSITNVHRDIVEAHILTRLDGPSLAAVSCASAQLNALSSEDTLWMDVCAATWPSTRDPLVRRVISTFPSGHRSFFSDSYPLLHHPKPSRQQKRSVYNRRPSPTTGFISAVDIFYKDELVFSKVQATETESGWFRSSPFSVDLLSPGQSVPTGITGSASGFKEVERLEQLDLEENLTMSWIIIDPAMKRAVNLSSLDAVLIQRHWLTGNIQVRYSVVVAGKPQRGSTAEVVQFTAIVTFGAGKSEGGGGGVGGGERRDVTEVSLQVEDLEGRNLNGRDSWVILRAAMEEGGRRRNSGGKRAEAKERFEEFEEMKRERKRRQHRAEMALDLACVATCITALAAFWSYILFR